ncbi:MAG TPA: PAS domain S-box protein [Aurantimonas sp.]|jgi:PAS domain S-box-containing protein|nr:PAS domain S-box protein [Aurantimonas sp.]
MLSEAPGAPVEHHHDEAGELRARLAQQSAIAEFGKFALARSDLDPLLQEACRVAARGLGSPLAKALEKRPGEAGLLIRAGVGWRPGVVGVAVIGDDLASPAGFAFHTGEPVISNHLSEEKRFRTPRVMAEHGVKRAVNVIIRTADAAFGVLEVDSRDEGAFSERDVEFISALAGMLGVAIERARAQEELAATKAALEESDAHYRRAVELNPQVPWIADAAGHIIDFNTRWLEITGMSRESALDEGLAEAPHPEDREQMVAAWTHSVSTGEVYDEEHRVRTADGSYRWMRSRAAPWRDENGGIRLWYGSTEDIDERKTAELALKDALAEKDLLVREVDHRVKNSLAMVGSLLSMQERSVHSPEAKLALAEASARLLTIARLHEQLYRSADVGTVRLDDYLANVCEDIVRSVGRGDARIDVEVGRIDMPSDEAVPLGLITAELLTNALKHAGDGPDGSVVRVSFAHGDEGCRLLVRDHGPGLPEHFDPAKSDGLGMRLVRSLSRSLKGRLMVANAHPGACFSVTLPETADAC